MKVSELIEKLRALPQDATVGVFEHDTRDLLHIHEVVLGSKGEWTGHVVIHGGDFDDRVRIEEGDSRNDKF